MKLGPLPLTLTLLFCAGRGVPAQSTPEAARAAAMEASRKAIQAECDKAAGGDWQLWFDKLMPYRTAIKPRIDAAVDNPWRSETNPANFYAI